MVKIIGIEGVKETKGSDSCSEFLLASESLVGHLKKYVDARILLNRF